MKLQLASLVCLGLAPLVLACSDSTSSTDGGAGDGLIAEGRSRSDVSMKKLEIDLGTVYQRLSYDLEFPFEVNGPDPITFEEIDTSCGCTEANIRPDWDPDFEGEFWPLNQPIPAGASGTVVAIFDGSLYKEEKASTITLRGNFLSNKITLGVSAFIEPIFKLSPPEVRFKDMQLTSLAKEPVSKEIKVTAMGAFEVVRWRRVTPGIIVQESGEAEILGDGRMVRTFKVSATSDLPEGRLASNVIAETDIGENLEFIVTGTALGPIRYSPQALKLSFGVLDQGPKRTRAVKLDSTGLDIPQPTFELVGAAADVMVTTLEIREDNKKYSIKVVIPENTPAGQYDGLLRISFPDESGIPVREVVVKALIR